MMLMTTKITRTNIQGLSLEELTEIIVREGFSSYRARQIFHWRALIVLPSRSQKRGR
jgi:adenine C2-methylase RlmN of 23S rRNA A2503 and tRNA A37